jgi:hypothetical protein
MFQPHVIRSHNVVTWRLFLDIPTIEEAGARSTCSCSALASNAMTRRMTLVARRSPHHTGFPNGGGDMRIPGCRLSSV